MIQLPMFFFLLLLFFLIWTANAYFLKEMLYHALNVHAVLSECLAKNQACTMVCNKTM